MDPKNIITNLVTDFIFISGLPGLRRGLVKLHQQQDGVTMDPENIVTAPGSKQLIYLIMAVSSGG